MILTKQKVGLFLAVFIFCLVSFAGSASAEVINVNPGPNAIANAIETAQPGDTLNLSNGIYQETNLNLDKNLTIQGGSESGATISGGDTGKILSINSGVNVTLTNLIFENAYSNYPGPVVDPFSKPGGAINNYGTVTMNSCLFSGNHAKFCGAAIYNYLGTVNIYSSNFEYNEAGDLGGAIYNDGGTLAINNSIFYLNNVINMGGLSIYNAGTLQVYGSEFYSVREPTLPDVEGIIYNYGGDSTSRILNYCRFYGTAEVTCIYCDNGTMNAMYNWWNSNSDPQYCVWGAVTVSPWLYMTYTVNPAQILYGGSSTLTVSLNNVYNGITVTPINPATGHILDGCQVTFTTDLGSVGSKITNKYLINGTTTATFTANEGIGNATITAQMDMQTLNNNILIKATLIYVNGAVGNDSWDGSSPTHTSGLFGPMKTIQAAVNAINTGGTINVASGVYTEHLTINKSLNLVGANRDTTIIDGTHDGRPIYVAASANNVNISNFSIRNGTSSDFGGGIFIQYANGVTLNNCIISGNTAFNGGGIAASGVATVNNCIISENSATFRGGGIWNGYNILTVRYSRITDNTAPNGIEIYQSSGSVDARYNWWGSNTDPSSLFVGTVDYSPWLYMDLTSNPTIILKGETSTLTASFNNAYNGSTVTPLNPTNGHLPDGCVVTFTTDLGSVGSLFSNKNTSNGVAVATLTADGGLGTAHPSAQLDSQTANTTINVTNILYVNGETGEDKWNGLSPTYLGGRLGPMKTIANALKVELTDGTIYVANGTYNEALEILNDISIIGSGACDCVITASNPEDNIITIANKVTKSLISGFTITGATSGTGIAIESIVGANIENNIIFNNRFGITVAEEAGKVSITGNNIYENEVGIFTLSNNILVNFNSFYHNSAPIAVEVSEKKVDATYNWWGNNKAPEIEFVTTSPWLYMTFSANPSQILNAQTSTLTTNFNNAYDGTTVKPLDPSDGHLPDGCAVTFTTDLGSVGSQTTNKNTSNGTAIATLTADGNPGTAHISAQFDEVILTSSVLIIPVRYVNGENGSDTWDGSNPVWISGTIGPMKTIQNAINTVETNGVVSVATGTYLENLIINKTITIQTQGTVNINGSLNPTQPVIKINSDGNGTTIQGFHITHGSNGIELEDTSNCLVLNNNITENNFAGIYLSNSNQNNLTNNNITGNPYGIFSEYGDNNLISSNIITQNPYAGVVLRYWSDQNTVTGNTLNDNGYGLHLLYSSANTIKDNQMTSNDFYGIYMDNSQNNILQNNNITNNPYAGIALYFSANNNNITSNNLTGNGFGTYLYLSHQNNLTNNNITSNSFYGVYLDSSDSNKLEQNTIQNNPYAGIALYFGSDHNTIGTMLKYKGNNITNNGFGMYLYQSNQNQITNNNITNNTYYGLYLDDSDSNTIITNTINGNPYTGIALYFASDANIIGRNTINNNGFGIYIHQSNGGSTEPAGDIYTNNITDNLFYGIYMDQSTGIIITENTIQNNPYAGIALNNDSTKNKLQYNNLEENGFGIYADNSNGNKIYQNNFYTNTAFAYDNGTNNWDNETNTGNYYNDWPTTNPRDIPGGSNIDHYPNTAPFET